MAQFVVEYHLANGQEVRDASFEADSLEAASNKVQFLIDAAVGSSEVRGFIDFKVGSGITSIRCDAIQYVRVFPSGTNKLTSY